MGAAFPWLPPEPSLDADPADPREFAGFSHPCGAAKQKSWMCTFPGNAEWELREGLLPKSSQTHGKHSGGSALPCFVLGTLGFWGFPSGNSRKGRNFVSLGGLPMDNGKVLLRIPGIAGPSCSSQILGNSGKRSSRRLREPLRACIPRAANNPVLSLRNSPLGFPDFWVEW